ncbi:hypothetical protein MRX96_026531 [Rhipicephalus microplus]
MSQGHLKVPGMTRLSNSRAPLRVLLATPCVKAPTKKRFDRLATSGDNSVDCALLCGWSTGGDELFGRHGTIPACPGSPTVGFPRRRRRAQRSAGSPCRARSGQSAASGGPAPGGPLTGKGSREVGGKERRAERGRLRAHDGRRPDGDDPLGQPEDRRGRLRGHRHPPGADTEEGPQARFEFNIVVVGRSGLGKSTLINTLFKANISRRSCTKKGSEGTEPAPYIIPKTTEVKSVSHVIEEKGTRLRLTVTDTPGFGDQINNENCWLPILEYINEQYEKYLSEEQSVTRKRHIPDTRVHCCLYFVPPNRTRPHASGH